ncbi:hypothetical protein TRIUR3_12176 [Triticum urartu]|uniref:Uncharacterized protein n=1 Tax=Triticum urartu TaxID=4572 RepID=M7Z0L5_TRIUA|nr:hypothetical protein TRIUR3_12176 [Triticum urartu]
MATSATGKLEPEGNTAPCCWRRSHQDAGEPKMLEGAQQPGDLHRGRTEPRPARPPHPRATSAPISSSKKSCAHGKQETDGGGSPQAGRATAPERQEGAAAAGREGEPMARQIRSGDSEVCC